MNLELAIVDFVASLEWFRGAASTLHPERVLLLGNFHPLATSRCHIVEKEKWIKIHIEVAVMIYVGVYVCV